MWKRICLVEWLKERGIFLSRSLLLVCLQFRITPIGEWTGFSICTSDTNGPIDLAPPSGVKRRCSFLSLHCAFAEATCATHDMQCPMACQSTAIQGSLPFVRLSKSPLFFFPGWLCHFKGLYISVWREIHLSKILPGRHDSLPIGQWVVFHSALDTARIGRLT